MNKEQKEFLASLLVVSYLLSGLIACLYSLVSNNPVIGFLFLSTIPLLIFVHYYQLGTKQ